MLWNQIDLALNLGFPCIECIILARYSTFLILIFLIYKIEPIPISKSCCIRMKRNNVWESNSIRPVDVLYYFSYKIHKSWEYN